MATYIFIQLAWEGKVFGDKTPPPFRRVNFYPSTENPLGQKGLLFENLWTSCARKESAGMCILDSDVCIDPIDFRAMWNAIIADNKKVHIAPARLWPISTSAPIWYWGHRNRENMSTWQDRNASGINMFSLCFTYLPRVLWETAIQRGMREWVYPEVDKNLYRVANEIKIPFNIVLDCEPKHMNY